MLYQYLQLNRRRSAGRGHERRPNHSAGGQQADSRRPGKRNKIDNMKLCPLFWLHLKAHGIKFDHLYRFVQACPALRAPVGRVFSHACAHAKHLTQIGFTHQANGTREKQITRPCGPIHHEGKKMKVRFRAPPEQTDFTIWDQKISYTSRCSWIVRERLYLINDNKTSNVCGVHQSCNGQGYLRDHRRSRALLRRDYRASGSLGLGKDSGGLPG